MSNGVNNIKNNKNGDKSKAKYSSQNSKLGKRNEEYAFNMSQAPSINQDTHWFQMLPIIIFGAIVIMVVKMASYERPMEQFFFYSGSNTTNDFFSYYKMGLIIACTIFAILMILYRFFVMSFYIKRSFAYIPMAVYTAFVLLSYMLSDYKLFALWGWNDRFEGTMVLFGYMLLLFYIINSVNTEKNVKWVLYPLAGTSVILGVLGITQALNHDFFKTDIGKKLITPSWFWDQIDSLNFTFTNQIYQTVYNINYVSFYLTLLIPIFGLLFIRAMTHGKEESLVHKITWALIFALELFNLIGSASSGGFLGMGAALILGLFVLNVRLLKWWKPVLILIFITVLVAGMTHNRWYPELSGSVNGVLGKQIFKPLQVTVTEQTTKAAEESKATQAADSTQAKATAQAADSTQAQTTAQAAEGTTNAAAASLPGDPANRHKLDYFETNENDVVLGYNGDYIKFSTQDQNALSLTVADSKGKSIAFMPVPDGSKYILQDERYNWITVKPIKDEQENQYIDIMTDGNEWLFRLTKEGTKYFSSGTGKLVDLHKVPAIGWENNQQFGSGRGYIWSRTIPMLKDTMFIGYGADTYCIYFPHEDYVGKYNSVTFGGNVNIVVDKPHNMYFGSMVGTGGISMLALLILWGIYILQSIMLYWKEDYSSFVSYAGVGIFLGICGFLVSGFVDDSSVSVMPMFYTGSRKRIKYPFHVLFCIHRINNIE